MGVRIGVIVAFHHLQIAFFQIKFVKTGVRDSFNFHFSLLIFKKRSTDPSLDDSPLMTLFQIHQNHQNHQINQNHHELELRLGLGHSRWFINRMIGVPTYMLVS